MPEFNPSVFSEKLEEMVNTDRRFLKYSYEGKRGHLIYTEPGFCNSQTRFHYINGWSEEEILEKMLLITECNCDECVNNLTLEQETIPHYHLKIVNGVPKYV